MRELFFFVQYRAAFTEQTLRLAVPDRNAPEHPLIE
jgi:hypothetical protein